MDSDYDELMALLESQDGIQRLISYVQNTEQDITVQANVFGLLEEYCEDSLVAEELHSSKVLYFAQFRCLSNAKLIDKVVTRKELGDVNEGLHLPIWRCLAAWANHDLLANSLWANKAELIAHAFALRHSPISTTSLICATIVSMVITLRNKIQGQEELLFCGLVSQDAQEFCGLIKQFYVFGGNAGCSDLIRHLVTYKTEVKAVFNSGLVRLWGKEWINEEKRESEFGPKWVALLLHFIGILHPKRPLLHYGSDMENQWASAFCALGLSPHKFVWMEIVPMISDILGHPQTRRIFLAHAHASGVLSWLLTKRESLTESVRLEFEDAIISQSACNLIELPELPIGLTLSKALEKADSFKEQGNRWFGMGNYTAARHFYRIALSTLKVAEASTLQDLNSPGSSHTFSIGARVKVRCADSSIKFAMVSDDPSNGKVEVIFDESGDDGVVYLHQCSHCLSLKDQAKLEALQISLCMNQAKCLSHLRMLAEAIECLTFGLNLVPEHLPALYLRGLLCLQTMQLKQSKDDFYQANAIAIKLKDKTTQTEIHRAWKKLKVLIAQRKKADKKLVKEMMAYLDTIAIEG
ncbi:hypothetical protein THRCLA_02559 [Thraustotheca clavata]|uniref:Uncharacterized protein n=1 Tax=Thraustotheca clavata TaxID=74557 RepID=A0A1W0A5J0_9STRA|nr:hypothetical protein THRCLA_02559 [Thraustotheca clavata]